MVGYQPDSVEMADMPKEIRFAVQARAASQSARLSESSLKDAYIALGRPDLPAVIDWSTAVDVFNLAPQRR
jgi:hypothetical protein